jgi:3-hydroxyisobutyrate dehydrogenase-like beta-hydroxyacid dehydrogenase
MTQQTNVTVIGLGVMGATLAELLINKQYKVTVWNRTADKAKRLAEKGATIANSVAEAVQASGVTIICISGYEAINDAVNQSEVSQALPSKTIINFTTGIPSEANQMNEFFNRHNAGYLDGAILSFADQMGKPDTTILLSGNEQAFEQYKDMLSVLGGNLKYLGTRPGAASALDQSVLSYMYGALAGFFHGVLIAEKEGIDISLLGEVIDNTTPAIGHFVKHEAKQIQENHFDLTISSVAMNAQAVQNIYNVSKDYGLDLSFPDLQRQHYARAEKLGLANKELASLIKVFREKN